MKKNGRSSNGDKANEVATRSVSCAECPLREQKAFCAISDEQLEFISTFKAGEVHVDAGATIFMQGTNSAHLYTLLSGWAFRYKTLPNGARQILNYALPGDFMGLQGTILDEMQHSIETLTPAVLCIFPRERMWDLYSRFPSLAFDVTWIAARSEQVLDEQLLTLGRRGAIQKVAFMLMHLYVRAERLGLVTNNQMTLPITQQHVADTLGMSLVHANKTIKRLIATRCLRWRDRTLEVLDREKLAEIAVYEEAGKERPMPLI